MTDNTEQPARRAMWEYAVLRSFDIPDIVTPEHAINTVARAVVNNTSKSAQAPAQGSIEVARRVVGFIVTLGSQGALDPLVVNDADSRQLRTTLINSTELNANDQFAGFVLDTVTDYIRSNPELPSHLLEAAYR